MHRQLTWTKDLNSDNALISPKLSTLAVMKKHSQMNGNFTLSDDADTMLFSGEDCELVVIKAEVDCELFVIEVEGSSACKRRISSCSRSCVTWRKPSVREWLPLSTHLAISSEVVRIAVNPLPTELCKLRNNQ